MRCASGSDSPARRRAATTASAARARSCIDGRRANSCLALAVAHQDAELTTIEGLGDGGALHPMQAAFVAHDAFQCGYCTPGQICSAVGMLARSPPAGPASSPPTSPPRRVALDDDEIRERMSGNLCRCAAYANIVPAIAEVGGAHEPVSLRARAPTRRRPSRRWRAAPAGAFLGGGTNLVDLMKLGVATAGAARRRRAPAATTASKLSPTAACGSARPCATATSPPTARSARAIRCSRKRCSPARRASCATSRRPAATCCSARAALLSGRLEAVQQARPGSGCPARGGLPPQPRDPRRVRGVHRDASVRHGGRAGRARRRRARAGPGGERTIPLLDFHRLPGDEPQRDTVLEHGELITAVDLPPLAVRGALALPQGARPRVVRVRARLGRRGARRRRRRGARRAASRWAASRTSRGARSAPRTRCAARRRPKRRSARAVDAELAQARPLRENAFKVPLARNVVVRTLLDLDGGRDDDRRPRASARRSTAIDGPLKVTGAAPYAFEYAVPRRRLRLRSCRARSRKGRIRLDRRRRRARAARRHRRAHARERAARRSRPTTKRCACCRPTRVAYHGQIVAAVVAETLEIARHAAGLIACEYDEAAARRRAARRTSPDLYKPREGQPGFATDTREGDVDAAFAARRVHARRDVHARRTSTTTRSSRTRRSRAGTTTA